MKIKFLDVFLSLVDYDDRFYRFVLFHSNYTYIKSVMERDIQDNIFEHLRYRR